MTTIKSKQAEATDAKEITAEVYFLKSKGAVVADSATIDEGLDMVDFIAENALQMVIWPIMLKQIKANRILKNKAKGN